MKSKTSVFVSLLLSALMVTSCVKTKAKEIVYPDYENTPADKNSWEYLLDDNGKPKEQVTFEWYVNDSHGQDMALIKSVRLLKIRLVSL